MSAFMTFYAGGNVIKGVGQLTVTFAKTECMEALIEKVRIYQNDHGMRTLTRMFNPAQHENITKENIKSGTNLIASIGKSVWETLVCDSVTASEQASPTRLM